MNRADRAEKYLAEHLKDSLLEAMQAFADEEVLHSRNWAYTTADDSLIEAAADFLNERKWDGHWDAATDVAEFAEMYHQQRIKTDERTERKTLDCS